jgi:hypothetical protein
MLKLRHYLFLFALLLLIGLCGARFFYIADSDREMYDYLVEISTADKEEYVGDRIARQHRGDVYKEVWFVKGHKRLRYSMHSKHSELVIVNSEEDRLMIENLAGIICFMQEELFYMLSNGKEAVVQADGRLLIRDADVKDPASWVSENTKGLVPMQLVRYLEADNGTYHYNTNSFAASEVKIKRFATEGHELINSIEGLDPLMVGLAQAVEFSLGREGINFKAHHLKATFFTTRGLAL